MHRPYSPLHNTGAPESDRFHRHTLPVARPRTNSHSPASASWSSVNSSQVHSVDSFSGNGRRRWEDRERLIAHHCIFFRQPFRCRGHQNRTPFWRGPVASVERARRRRRQSMVSEPRKKQEERGDRLEAGRRTSVRGPLPGRSRVLTSTSKGS